MAFTDDDLKRLKDVRNKLRPSNVAPNMLASEFDALIARLKAAEDFMFADEESYDEKFERWEKAAGK